MKKSEKITELAKALKKANEELKNVSYDTENPFFKAKYASLAHILETVRPILNKNGLFIMQDALMAEEKHLNVRTTLMHESGEWIESTVTIPIANGSRYDAQSAGAAISYGRRYALSAILNISSEEDDDGNSLVGNKKKGNNIDFDEIEKNVKNKNMDQLKDYWQELGKLKLYEKQQHAILNIFTERRKELESENNK
jgi:hypothetical protein